MYTFRTVDKGKRARTSGLMILLMTPVILLDELTEPIFSGPFRKALLATVLCLGIFGILERAGYWERRSTIRKLSFAAAIVLGPSLVHLVIR